MADLIVIAIVVVLSGGMFYAGYQTGYREGGASAMDYMTGSDRLSARVEYENWCGE